MHMNSAKCYCFSSKSYDQCCKPLHKGRKAIDPQALMRSRFSAYAQGNADYLIKTTHPASPLYTSNHVSWKRKILDFCESSSFEGLEILGNKEKIAKFSQEKSLATVTFMASIRDGNRDASFTEKALFQFLNGSYYYLLGEVKSGACPELVDDADFDVMPISYYGQEVLRQRAIEVDQIDQDIYDLVEKMYQTMRVHRGIGLAAPQVGVSLRVFMTYLPDEHVLEEDESELLVFINPIISDPSSAKWIEQEGCLSIPGVYAEVERPNTIHCEYTSLDGKRQKRVFSGWAARAILHENDHLNGVLFPDRVPPKQRTTLESQLKSFKSRQIR